MQTAKGLHVLGLLPVTLMWLFLKGSCWRMKSNMQLWIPLSTLPILSDQRLVPLSGGFTYTTSIQLKINSICSLEIWRTRLWIVETTGCTAEEVHSETPPTHVRLWLASGLRLLRDCHRSTRISPERLRIYIFKICISDHLHLELWLLWKLFPT